MLYFYIYFISYQYIYSRSIFHDEYNYSIRLFLNYIIIIFLFYNASKSNYVSKRNAFELMPISVDFLLNVYGKNSSCANRCMTMWTCG